MSDFKFVGSINRTITVIRDCTCQHYIHEITNHPRPGLEARRLKKGDKVQFIREWWNFYGQFIRVIKDGDAYEYDLLVEDFDYDELKKFLYQ